MLAYALKEATDMQQVEHVDMLGGQGKAVLFSSDAQGFPGSECEVKSGG